MDPWMSFGTGSPGFMSFGSTKNRDFNNLQKGIVMNVRLVVIAVSLGLALALFTCSSRRSNDHQASCIVGADTLSLVQVLSMEPDSASVKAKISRAALEMALCRESGLPCGGTVKDRGLYSDLSNQLSLQTGTAWPAQSAACLYNAAKAVRMKLSLLPTAQAVAVYIDSLFLKTVRLDSSVAREIAANDSLLATLDNKRTRQDLEILLRAILHISPKTAYVLADFLVSEDKENAGSVDVSSSVKGLVADTTHFSRKPHEVAAFKAATVQDPKLVLKYRPQHLISDSINKHIPTLEAIYKKQLKTHPNLSGTVWVTFVILPDGAVASTQIHSTDIGEKDFLNPFSQYVQRIRFSKIPDNIGPMTFEFPFEFAPEN
jgi:hypothetical protein